MRLSKTFILSGLFLFTLIFLYTSCRKFDKLALAEIKTPFEQFFEVPKGTDPQVIAIRDKILRQQQQKPFIDQFVTWAGFPNWDKAIVTKAIATNTTTIRSITGLKNMIYIPFANGREKKTSAILVAGIDNGDTSLKMIYHWQYANFPYKTDTSNIMTAEKAALIFMSFDNYVYGENKFQMDDTLLFKYYTPYLANRIIKINDFHATAQRLAAVVWICYEVQVPNSGWNQGCPPGDHDCNGYHTEERCDAYPQFDDEDWDGGGGPPGGGGGGGGGGDWNDNPCKTIGSNDNPCGGGGPGWEPIEDIDPYDPYNVDSIRIDTSIINNYPCLDTLLKQMPNVNLEAQLLLDSVFNVNTKINLTFVIGQQLHNTSYAALTYPTSASHAFQGSVSIYSDTIFINPDYINTATKEYIVSVIYHEAIHAYINYQFYLFASNQVDSFYIKEKFPIFWNQLLNTFPRTNTTYGDAQHEQIANSYINTIKNLILPFYTNPLATTLMKNKVSTSLAWGGLQKTTAWTLPGKDTCEIRQHIAAARDMTQTHLVGGATCSSQQVYFYDYKLSQPPCQ